MTAVTATKPATYKQLAYVQSLANDRDTMHLPDELQPVLLNVMADVTVSLYDASALISAMLSLPKRTDDDRVSATEGYYIRRGTVFVVVKSKSTQRNYAKRLVILDNRARWEYAPGIHRELDDRERLTIEEAAKLGRQYGICVVCSKTLTTPESVAAGIGPVCRRRLA